MSEIVRLANSTDARQVLKYIGCDSAGVKIMADKATHHIFYITNLSFQAANILKQDALSLGAELAVSANCSKLQGTHTDALLIIDERRLARLIAKEKSQPFGLKKVAAKLGEFLNIKQDFKRQVMGVLNVNDDSFYTQSRVSGDNILEKAKKLIDDGADILDIGAVSSRPGSHYPGAQEELKRIVPAIDMLYGFNLSIDTFDPEVAKYALEKGAKIINDISGLQNIKIAELCAKYEASLVIMHKQGETHNMQNAPSYKNVMCEIEMFFEEKIKIATDLGVENLILDVGIGFGKTLEHNLSLIKHLAHFKKFGYPLLIGASRKSMIDKIFPSDVSSRLGGTLAIHLKALQEGASILRVHDVYEHKQALAVWEAINDNQNFDVK